MIHAYGSLKPLGVGIILCAAVDMPVSWHPAVHIAWLDAANVRTRGKRISVTAKALSLLCPLSTWISPDTLGSCYYGNVVTALLASLRPILPVNFLPPGCVFLG